MDESTDAISKDSGHQSLEHRGCIAISHLHYLALKGAEYHRECHLADILQSYVHLVGAHMLIYIYVQSQSKYISVFSLILFLYYFHFTVRTPFQFFLNFFPIFVAILFTSKACHFDTALLIFASVYAPAFLRVVWNQIVLYTTRAFTWVR